MKKNNVRRMPYNKTRRREKQLEVEDFDKQLAKGNRKNLLIFFGVVVVVLLAATGLVYLTTFIPEVVHSVMGAEQ